MRRLIQRRLAPAGLPGECLQGLRCDLASALGGLNSRVRATSSRHPPFAHWLFDLARVQFTGPAQKRLLAWRNPRHE